MGQPGTTQAPSGTTPAEPGTTQGPTVTTKGPARTTPSEITTTAQGTNTHKKTCISMFVSSGQRYIGHINKTYGFGCV